MEASDDFVERLRQVLQFLQDHGFNKAAEAVYESLENLERKPSLDSADEQLQASLHSAPVAFGEDQDFAGQEGPQEEYRSRSAEPVLVSSRGASEDADEGREEQRQSPWLPGDAAALTKRLSGSTRLYEDPDVDEYEGMDDIGYVRRLVPHQQEFIMRQLDLLQDSEVEGYAFPASSSEQPYIPSESARSRSSASSSASLSSPGMSSCKQNHAGPPLHDNAQQQDQQGLGSSYQVRAGSYGSSPTAAAAAAATGDAAWDSGPAGIVFAEPVTTPTKDSRRSTSSEPKCSLSRVESLSNSFIDELESCEGAGDRDGRLSEVCSTGGDISTSLRRSGADGSSDSAPGGRSSTDAAAGGGYDDVIDLSPPSPPPDCAADAGIDLSNIFELGLRGSSRTSSVDVLYGSVRCCSETDSELSNDHRPRSQGAGSTSAPGLLSGLGRAKPASKLQPQQQEQQQPEQQQESSLLEQQQEQELQQEQTQLQQQDAVQPQAEQQQEIPQLDTQQQEQQQETQQQLQAAEEPAEQQQQQIQSPTSSSDTAAPGLTLAAPAPAAAGGSGGGGGFGFSFPTTPPSAVDAAVHEERAERVFSTWASNHSRSGLDAAGASDDEADTGSSKPFVVLPDSSSDAAQEAADPNDTSWEFPMTPAAVPELGMVDGDADAASIGTGGYAGSELGAPRYVVDESGNLLYEYDAAYVDSKYETFELRVIHRRRHTGFEDSKEFPIRKNDLIAGRYQVMDFLGSAAFSQAVQALDTATGALVCLKIIKNNKDYFDQSLDEIKLLRYVNAADPEDEHHIVRLYDFFYYKEHLFLVCELLRANLYEFQKYQRENGDEPYFTPPRIQRIATQVLQSLAFLHSLGLVHSDLKPENILIKSYSRCEVKVIDLGSSCFVTDHLSSYVQSRSYRAPEVILGLAYGQKVDLWSLGCILAELATGYVLFQNDSLATLLVRLEGILGPLPSWMISQGRYSSRYYTRSRQIYERNKSSGRYELLLPKHTSLRHRVPGADEGFLDFLSYLLTPDPSARPSAEDALQHPWLSHPYPPAEQIPD
ncbi:hypothetical protein OEZ86_008720 [Tetradesmus obliquus]|nr:hypothetical protein OEZ86_008720 [Tetradesmus obliquus]